jgi:AcrR family transcriptional regulator
LSRQTVYAHFGSREELLEALADRAAERLQDAMDAADLDTGPALAALLRMLEMAWQTFEAEPFLLSVPRASTHSHRDGHRHAPVVDRLARILDRGRKDGDIDPSLPLTWLTSAALALGHAAGEDVRDGRMTPGQALAALRLTTYKAFRATDHDQGHRAHVE